MPFIAEPSNAKPSRASSSSLRAFHRRVINELSIASHPLHRQARAIHRAIIEPSIAPSIAEPSHRARAPTPSCPSPSCPTTSRLVLHRQAFEHSIIAPSPSRPSQAIRFIAEREPSIAPSLSPPAERELQCQAVHRRAFQRRAVSCFIAKPSSTPSSRHHRAVLCKPSASSTEPSIASHLLHCQARAPTLCRPSPRHPTPSRPMPSRLVLHRQAFKHAIVPPSPSCPLQAIRFIAECEPSIAPSMRRPLGAICFIVERKLQRCAVHR